MDDVVWVPSVFTKNRERLIAHDAIIELFNHIVETAGRKGWLSGEHFSVDGTLIQAWASHRSFVRKDGGDDDDAGNNSTGSTSFKGQTRGNDTHAFGASAGRGAEPRSTPPAIGVGRQAGPGHRPTAARGPTRTPANRGAARPGLAAQRVGLLVRA